MQSHVFGLKAHLLQVAVIQLAASVHGSLMALPREAVTLTRGGNHAMDHVDWGLHTLWELRIQSLTTEAKGRHTTLLIQCYILHLSGKVELSLFLR